MWRSSSWGQHGSRITINGVGVGGCGVLVVAVVVVGVTPYDDAGGARVVVAVVRRELRDEVVVLVTVVGEDVVRVVVSKMVRTAAWNVSRSGRSRVGGSQIGDGVPVVGEDSSQRLSKFRGTAKAGGGVFETDCVWDGGDTGQRGMEWVCRSWTRTGTYKFLGWNAWAG